MGITNYSGTVGGTTHLIRSRQIRPTDPTPVAGDWYINTTIPSLNIYDGTQWWSTIIGTSTSTTTSSTSTTSSSTSTTSSSTTTTSISTTSTSISTTSTSTS